MAVPNHNIKLLEITVQLGNNPGFEVHADDSDTVTPAEAKFHRKGAGEELVDLLNEIVDKIKASYPKSDSITLCIDGKRIVPASECHDG